MVVPKDTSDDAFIRQLDALRALGPGGRLRLAAELSDDLREIATAGIRSRHPEYDDRQVAEELADLLLGEELATAARRARLSPTR